MPFRIQRVPQGLNNLLSIFGGATPVDLEDRVQASLELIQFYGLQQQRVVFGNDAALAEGSQVSATVNFPAVRGQWAVLFNASVAVVKTATVTALRASLRMQRAGSGNTTTIASDELGPFGATETGVAHVVFNCPYPLILVPPWDIFARLDILGTDANANVTGACEIGILQ